MMKMLVKWEEDDTPSLFTVPTSQKNPQKNIWLCYVLFESSSVTARVQQPQRQDHLMILSCTTLHIN